MFFYLCISSELLLVICLPVEDNLSQQLLPLLLILVRCLGGGGHGQVLGGVGWRGGWDLSRSPLVPVAWSGAVNLKSWLIPELQYLVLNLHSYTGGYNE